VLEHCPHRGPDAFLRQEAGGASNVCDGGPTPTQCTPGAANGNGNGEPTPTPTPDPCGVERAWDDPAWNDPDVQAGWADCGNAIGPIIGGIVGGVVVLAIGALVACKFCNKPGRPDGPPRPTVAMTSQPAQYGAQPGSVVTQQVTTTTTQHQAYGQQPMAMAQPMQYGQQPMAVAQAMPMAQGVVVQGMPIS